MSRRQVLRAARRWLNMSPALRSATLRALCAVPAIEVGLRICNLPYLCRQLGLCLITNESRESPPTRRAAPRALDIEDAQRAAELALRKWKHPANCLRRALLTGYLLRDERPLLEVGVRRRGASCEAHAWLTIGDVRVDLIDEPETFRPLAHFDVAAYLEATPPLTS